MTEQVLSNTQNEGQKTHPVLPHLQPLLLKIPDLMARME